VQVLLRLEIEAVCGDSNNSDQTAANSAETLKEVLLFSAVYIFSGNLFCSQRWHIRYVTVNFMDVNLFDISNDTNLIKKFYRFSYTYSTYV